MYVVDNNVVRPAELRALFSRTRDNHSLSELVGAGRHLVCVRVLCV